MRHRAFLAALLLLLALLLPGSARAQERLMIWHAYRGDELTALMDIVRIAQAEMPGVQIETLAVPFDAYASKLENAIPHGHGPDLFIDAHERLTGYVTRGLVADLDAEINAQAGGFEPVTLAALTREGHRYAFPLSIKCLALYVNTDVLREPPTTLEQIEALRGTLPHGVYPLVYYAQNAYFHAPFAHAFGAGLLDDATGRYLFVGEPAARSIELVARLLREGVVPEEADGALVSQLFAAGRGATAISGPWLAADLGPGVHYRVVPLPTITEAGGAMAPYATVEGAFVSSRAQNLRVAVRFAELLAGRRGAVLRATVGHQVVASLAAWDDPAVGHDPLLSTFREAARSARPIPSHPFMRAAFEQSNRAIVKSLRGDVPVREALAEGLHRFQDVTRPVAPRRSPMPALLIVGALGLLACFQLVRRARDPVFRRDVMRSMPAYRYVLHAAVTVVLLVIAPLAIGAATSFYAGRDGDLHYAGLANYVDILTARGGSLFGSGSFYLVLLVTVLWTVSNIALHVMIGVALALLLNRPALKFKGLYRVLLIIPWAVPSYVTALAWKGMFHRQLGAINAVISTLGGHPVAWFSRFSTAFAANLATNVWLGFPFMMVVTLGALTSIPKDLYEAAAVDGATPWQRFRKITLPLLRPSLAPAVAMGAVWTFNMFNVIFLVSGGEPDGQTEILVTEAYRWAFTRQAQYGYAAAYAVLIFGILVVLTRAADAAAARAGRVGG